jgi:hypothetical protein
VFGTRLNEKKNLFQDLNDSPPVFSRQRYFTSVSADLEVGSSILKVEATDADKVAIFFYQLCDSRKF